jgi:hypothetical protein
MTWMIYPLHCNGLGKHASVETDTHSTMAELLEAVFSIDPT